MEMPSMTAAIQSEQRTLPTTKQKDEAHRFCINKWHRNRVRELISGASWRLLNERNRLGEG
jgi:hypothetical protein